MMLLPDKPSAPFLLTILSAEDIGQLHISTGGMQKHFACFMIGGCQQNKNGNIQPEAGAEKYILPVLII